MDKIRSVTAFGALSQETRLDVVRLLIQAGSAGMAAGEIGEVLGVKQNTMSANLSVLAHAGLVKSSREGRSIRYFADFDNIKRLLTFLMRDCCGSRPELCQPIFDEIKCGC